ncbi:hypothetical protein [Algiphilus sp.]|uniref:hypothetical protein n=1 Tax=Algiphilus sp. TaxID=1872431 RepID=UPI001CA6D4AF|nr:hypothetical protein [Algiphilus sp.]MBY8965572.1 hypothetical protein [Algiphilus acroporae]MCI5062525.1 hypothetical protein [Algiphilus sp.]MCI5102679.1 hypothetical protein [Algiphilus sp.]MCR9090683.1 hypothetical protein [Pseudomonadota bacterium]
MRAVTAGYLLAGAAAAATLFSLGWLILLGIPVLLLWHGVRSLTDRDALSRSHERFLLQNYVWHGGLLLLLYALPLVWLFTALDPQSELAAVLGTRDPEAIVLWFKLWAADQLRDPSPVFAANVAGGMLWLATHAIISALIGILLLLRLIRRFLRWSERQPARSGA